MFSTVQMYSLLQLFAAPENGNFWRPQTRIHKETENEDQAQDQIDKFP